MLLAWMALASWHYVGAAATGRSALIALASQRDAYEARLARLLEQQRDIETRLNEANLRRAEATVRLGDTHQRLIDSEHRLAETEVELAALREALDDAQSDGREEKAQAARLEAELRTLRRSIASADAASGQTRQTIERVGAAVEEMIVERDFAVARNQLLRGHVAQLESKISGMSMRHDEVYAQLETATEVGLDGLDRLFRRAGLDVEDLISKVRRDYSGQGGPFEPVRLAALTPDSVEDERLAEILSGLERINLMRFAAERLPFSRPVQGGRFTSGFGPRRDPLRRRVSMHRGIDIAGPRGTPIRATADGVVTFVGRQSGYGRVIEIRHAFGFETVYAHLQRARVSVGQRVERGDRIGDMGNTGRATGIHLHYEVRIDSVAVNPMKFIEAARDVL